MIADFPSPEDGPRRWETPEGMPPFAGPLPPRPHSLEPGPGPLAEPAVWGARFSLIDPYGGVLIHALGAGQDGPALFRRPWHARAWLADQFVRSWPEFVTVVRLTQAELAAIQNPVYPSLTDIRTVRWKV